MSYIDQLNEWLKKHPNATDAEKKAWLDGYDTCTDNWCTHRR